MLAAAPAGACQLLTDRPPPQAIFYGQPNSDYTVHVRTTGGEWNEKFAYRVRVDGHHPQPVSMANFDFDGLVEVEDVKNKGRFHEVSFMPALPGRKPSIRGQAVRFILKASERFSLPFDLELQHNLHIVTGPVQPPPPASAPVFGTGLHAPDNGGKTFDVQSGEKIYLQGNFVLKDVHDVHILGRSLICNSGRAIELDQAQNVDIDDLITVNDETAAAARVMNVRHSVNVHIDGISGLTAGKRPDGINISTSQHVSLDHASLRTSDDAVLLYAVSDCPICHAIDGMVSSPLSHATFDIRVSHSVPRPDVAHATFVGHFRDVGHPREIHDASFGHIQVLSLDESQPAWQGATVIFFGDTTLIRDIRLNGIRVDRILDGKLINIVAGDNAQYNKAPGRGVSDVVPRDIAFTGDGLTIRL